MKLELKHLAPYLPYGVKIEVQRWSKLFGEYQTDELILTNKLFELFCQDYYSEFKPILRPLKDIIFFPKILNKYYIDYNKTEGVLVKRKNENYVRMDELNFLFEHHFDVFGLIEKDLAIDINTLFH